MSCWLATLSRQVDDNRHALAMADPSGEISRTDLWHRIELWSSILTRQGILPNDRVLIMLEPGLQAWIALLAVVAAGAVAMPVPATLSDAEFRRLCRLWAPSAFLTTGSLRPASRPDCHEPDRRIDLESLPQRRLRAQDAQLRNGVEPLRFASRGRILLVSGAERAALYAVHQIIGNARRLLATLAPDLGLAAYLALPTHHWAGLVLGWGLMDEGRSIWFPGESRGEPLPSLPDDAGPLACFTTLRHWTRLLAQPDSAARLEQIRQLVCLRGLASAETFRRTMAALPGRPFDLVHGSPEHLAVSHLRIDDVPRPGSIGRPLPGIDIRVVREGDVEARPGRPGYLDIRTEPIAAMVRPERCLVVTAQAEGEAGRDIGWQDRDGHLFQLPRPFDMIRTGGRVVAPADLEQRVLDSNLVEEAFAFGVPHPVLEEAVVLMAVARPRVTPRHLREFCRDHLPGHMMPLRIELHPNLPALAQASSGRSYLRLRYTGLFRSRTGT